MVLDTSAIFSILTLEPDQHRYLEALSTEGQRLMSAATLYETAVVLFLDSGDASLIVDLNDLIDELGIEIVPFDSTAAWEAFEAYTRFGKGIHPARLNLLDCVAYQLARHVGHTILFKGNDFSRTDALPAV
ncbi:MAG: type II toxin-antitoxin system VapC family toxin [Bryobacteraceae bacterium]